MIAYGFEAIDFIALAFHCSAWCMHSWIVNHSRWRVHTISYRMIEYRRQWMLNMTARDLRMVDALIQNSLQQGVLFFASTSILVIGGLLAGVGSADAAIQILGEFRFSSTNTRTEWEVKVLLVVIIFMFAFFKFAWSYRLFNYVTIMIGAAPEGQAEQSRQESEGQTPRERYAEKVAQLHAIGARHFTSGLSAYFFALGTLGWFLNGWVFIATTVWVSLVLYRRALRSNFMKILAV